ncbi:hypothetical protein M9458_050768 [Cirrhinus mrigala]|uniref:ribonuclease H n=1 Tax=Cirrhinus mrigala TaxID=683832 RepID=A0ABD0MV79_CIRMR
MLPYVQQAQNNPDVSFRVTALSDTYVQKLGKTTTQTYLSELEALASRSGESFEDVLRGMLAHIHEVVVPKPCPEPTLVEAEGTLPAHSEDLPQTDSTFRQSQVTASAERPHTVPPVSAATSPESTSLTIGDLNPPAVQKVVVEHLVRTSDLPVSGNSPLRLRAFSGRVPHPPNEADYETWRTSVELLLQDPAVSDFHRVRRICESLLSPAADIVKSLSSTALPLAYIQLLDSAFAPIEDGDELFVKFLNTFQNPGEKPSAYLQRLHVALQTTMRRGGVLSSEINKHLLKQFCRGCWESSLLLELQLEQKKDSPPSFAELMTVLRIEESKHATKSVQMKQHLGSSKQRVVVQSQAAVGDDVTQLHSVTAQLASQITELQKQLAVLTSKQSKDKSNCKTSAIKSVSKQSAGSPKGKDKASDKSRPTRPKPGYCFRCGEEGHIASSCSNDPNPTLVAEKRSQLTKRQNEWDLQYGSPKPRGLIGTRCTAQVDIAGTTFDCLLDTGSQVTTITQSFYNRNLCDLQIHSLDNLLEVESANGQNVPYLGYVEVTITFPRDFVGIRIEVPTLALVIPDLPSSFQPSILIGTNTLDELYKDFSQQKPQYFSPSYGYKQVLKILELRQKQAVEGNVGLVRLPEKQSQMIPAGQSTVLCGTVSVQGVHPDKWVVVEHPSFSSLPGGLIVKTCVVTLGETKPCRLPVVISNPTVHDITIPARCIVAELKAVQSVISNKRSNKVDVTESVSKSSLEFNFSNSPIPPEWKERLIGQLREMPEVFSLHPQDFGRTDKVKHKINLMDETPFKHRPRPIHPEDMEAVKKHLQELLDAGVIRESMSPYSSPIVVVKKKSGDIRLCIDYRKLNQRTIKDAYALPKLEDTFMALVGSKWFSVLDLKSGFYQIEVDEKDKAKTAFVCPVGFYEFNRMPQGVTNAPSTFQRVMEKCMADINLREVLVFIDDIIVFSKDLEEHEERLLRVLRRLKEYGLKLAPEKCVFAQTSVRYLGHIVSDKGVQTDPDKVAAVKTWPVPRNLKELRSFLGFIGYYRRFVKDFSKKVKPLNDLTSGYPPTRQGMKSRNNGHYRNPKDFFNSRAFDQIIEELTTAPILAFADPKLPYILHTDASTSGLGAALYQEQDGQKFHDFLYGSTFTVVTDSNPLTYVLSTAKLDAVGDRGPDFESHLIRELCDIAGVRKVRTTPYHPRGNPVERFNRTLLNMLGTLEAKKKSCWKEYVKPLVHAYNCTRNETTGFSPYELMFGRQPRLPVDLAFGLPLKGKADVTHSQYVKNLKSSLEESFRIAVENSKRMAEKNKTRYDKHVIASELDNGDRVLVRSVRLRGKNKLADKWEETVYVVVDRYGDLPVYKVCPEFQTGPIRTLHRDLLLPCGTLSSDVSELETQSLVPRHKTRSKVISGSPEEDTSDSEEQVYHSGSQFEVVDEFFTVHTPKVTKPGKEDITQSLGTGYGSATSESQVIETSPVNPEETSSVNPEETSSVNPEETSHVDPEENSPGNPGVQSERKECIDFSPTATLVAQDPSLNGEPCMPEPSSAGEELNVVENMETNMEAIELVHPQSELRRSVRTKEKPKILTYPKLGNPLVTIVQSLLQGLNEAFSESLQDCSHMSCPASHEYVATGNMQRDLHGSKGGGCNQGSKTFVV